MIRVTRYDSGLYEGAGWMGQIDGVDIKDLTPIANPGPIYYYETYRSYVYRPGEPSVELEVLPDSFPIGNGQWMLTEDEYAALMAAQPAPKPEPKLPPAQTETREQRAARWAKAKEYDDIYNEGGEGYNPYRVKIPASLEIVEPQ